MTHFFVIPIAGAADLGPARGAVESLRPDRDVVVVLDLLRARGGGWLDAEAAAALQEAVQGAGRRLEALVPREGERGRPPAVPSAWTWHSSLLDCLEAARESAEAPLAVELTLPARLEYLAPLRRHVAGVVRRLHGDADSFRVEVLVDEVCLNAVENSPSETSTYDVSVQCDDEEFRLTSSNAFDARVDSEEVMRRRLTTFDDSGNYLGERGRGLFLIARMADGLEIRSVGDRIEVTVHRRLGGG